MTKSATTFRSVWDALADSPEQAANLRARADLMRRIADLITAKGWTQVEAAEALRHVVRAELSLIAAALGFRVKVSLRAA